MNVFKNVEARYALRCVLVGVAAVLPLVATSGTWREIVVSGVGATLSYAGIGAVVPAVEPQIGKKLGP
jgi:hypothetical protein